MNYWILTKDVKGPGVLGPYYSEYRAQIAADKLDTPNWEIIPLRTSNPGKATSILKEQRIGKEGLEEGSQNFSHSVGRDLG